MTEEEKREKIKEYSERHSFWTNQVLNQFGFSINFFLSIGIGFVAYLVTQRNNYPVIYLDCKSEIHWGLSIYLAAMCMTFVSIVVGAISAMSRLYDLRLTRHIIWIRKQAVKKIKKLLPEEFIDLKQGLHWQNFIATLENKSPVILEADYSDYNQLKNKFNSLRKQSKLLGELSWKTHKIQIALIMLSTIIY